MKVILWDIPIRASSVRSNELESLIYDEGRLGLILKEEESDNRWSLVFRPLQAFRITTEECITDVVQALPQSGGFFEVQESDWLKELGGSEVHFLKDSRHFVVCCYEENIEIISSNFEINQIINN